MRPRRWLFLLCLLTGVLVAAAPRAHSQEASKPAWEPAASQPEAKPQPAHSREAAGEGDEEAQFKQSPSVKWIAEHTGLSPAGAYWVSLVLNFVIVAVVLGVILKSPMASFFRERTAGIQKSVEEARRASDEASRRLGEIERRLARLDAEITGMRASADLEAEREERTARADAEEAKAKIVRGAEQEIAAAARLARGELRSYAAELAVSLAEKKIQVSAATDRALVREFVEQLGKDSK
ncbi:MAG: ATPase [Terriglobales bacterium]